MGWITRQDRYFPAALPGDGCMDMLITPGGQGPLQTIQGLIKVGRDRDFDFDTVGYKKVKAYRVIPRDQKTGFVSIDGESVPFEPFQVEVHQTLARVLSKSSLFAFQGPTGWDKGAESKP